MFQVNLHGFTKSWGLELSLDNAESLLMGEQIIENLLNRREPISCCHVFGNDFYPMAVRVLFSSGWTGGPWLPLCPG